MFVFAIDWTHSWHARISYAHIRKRKGSKEHRNAVLVAYICIYMWTSTDLNNSEREIGKNVLKWIRSTTVLWYDCNQSWKRNEMINIWSIMDGQREKNAFDHVENLHPIWLSANKTLLSSPLRFHSRRHSVNANDQLFSTEISVERERSLR